MTGRTGGCTKGHVRGGSLVRWDRLPSLPSARPPARSTRGPLLRSSSLHPAAVVLLGALMALTGVAALPATPAAAASCPSPGGADLPFERQVADPGTTPDPGTGRLDPAKHDNGEYQLILNGGGWGHGIGMSQYGAFGAGLLGCSYTQILEGFFPDAQVGDADTDANVRVGLFPNTPQGGPVEVVNVRNSGGGTLTWTLDDKELPKTQPAGEQWTVHFQDGGFVIREGADTASTAIWPEDGQPAGQKDSVLRAPLAGTRVHLTSKGMDYSRGTLEFTSKVTSQSAGMTVVVDVPTIEQYLYGLAEVPSSWGEDAPAALDTQAVAGRSFVTDRLESGWQRPNCGCHVYDSTSDQVYSGWSKEAGPDGDLWVEAVDRTAGKVLTWDQHQDGTQDVVPIYYSSSHGGHSSAAADIWNSSPTTSGYLEAVDISRWEQAAADANPYMRWSAGFTADELAARLGVDAVLSFEVVQRAPGGRPCTVDSPDAATRCDGQLDGVVVTGVVDGDEVVKDYDSEAIRSALGGSPRSRNGVLNGLFHVDEISLPWQRLAGETRGLTAIRLAQAGWDDGSDTVVLAREDEPADALTGSALAGTHDAPLLLAPRDGLTDQVRAELQRLDPDEVLLLGGTAALSRQVADDVRALDIAVRRVQGPDRHATAVDVASRVSRGDQTTAYLVRLYDGEVPARGWVDALSVAAVAARRAADGAAWPILGTEDSLPEVTQQAIEDLGITTVVPIGGSATIPPQVIEQLQGLGVEVTDRLAGQDRYGTSRAVSVTDTPTTQSLVIATGENFPDGLAAGPYAARTGQSLLLVPTELHDGSPWNDGQHPAFIANFGWDDPRLYAVGGTVAIETPVILRVAALLEGARP